MVNSTNLADGSGPHLPVTLGQGGVIPGFEQGLEGAKAGEKLMFVSHSSIIPPGYASTTETANWPIMPWSSCSRMWQWYGNIPV